MQTEDGNGRSMPCYIQSDCPLLQEQATGNDIARDMLAELKALNTSLVGPATGRKQVSSWIFLGTVIPLCVLILVLIIRDSQKDFHATAPGGASVHVESFHGEKKTP